MKLTDLKKLTGIDVHTLSYIYNEEVRQIRFDTINKICEALKLKSINELIEYIPDEPSSHQDTPSTN